MAISGIGLVSPIGGDIPAFWDALMTGKSGLRRISRFDTTGYLCAIGGEVDDGTYEHLIDPRSIRTTTHVTRMALAATELALQDGRLGKRDVAPEHLGVSVGTALGGLREAEQQHIVLLERGARRVNPFIASATPIHGTGAEVAARLHARGNHFTFGSGCTASLQAIAHGAFLVASGDLEICIAGGTESPLVPVNLAALARTQELSTLNNDPTRASRPFDRDHAGMVLSEGACFVVLEPLDRARARGAEVYAEVLGSASSCDANGMYNLEASGETGARAVHHALARSSIGVDEIDYVCAHANSSPAFDCKEVVVLKKTFGEFAAQLPVSSIKAVLGHPFGASGAFQTAASALAIHHQTIPPTHNLDFPAPECDLDCVPHVARKRLVRTALISSYGYGGINSYLLLRRADL